MTQFHEDAIKFMQELLIKLEQQATAANYGSVVGIEKAEDVFLRLVGIVKAPNINIQGNDVFNQNLQEQATETSQSLVHSFFKISRNSTLKELKTINKLLRAYQRRLNRYSKARSKIKLNRIQKLIQDATNPLKSEELIKDTPEDTRREISKALRNLKEEGKLEGIINQEIAAHKALTTSIDFIINNIPEEVGDLRPQLISIIRSSSKESYISVERLNSLKDELSKEVDRLENEENLLFKGQKTFADGANLSLSKILDVLIFLSDRQRMKYECSQCKFFVDSQIKACTFAGEGFTAKTQSVSVTDQQGVQVSGRLTKSTNSCKDVWGLDTNDYFIPKDKIVQLLRDKLKE